MRHLSISLLFLLLLSVNLYAADSDRNTLPDGWEIDNGRDPLVADYQVTSLGDHTCALDDNGVQCWGYNEDGQTDVPDLRVDPDGDGFSNQNGADAFPLDATDV